MESKPGTYVLVLRSRSSTCTKIGRWGSLEIRPGYYMYVGSAFGPGGVLSRVSRHCRGAKSKHWHIDYLREYATPISIWYSHAPVHLEHQWAKALATMTDTTPVMGFGCSDCRCEAHLFFTPVEPERAAFVRSVRRIVKSWSCEAVNEHIV
ncbi:MAG: GIY-YIG nuclease family protein [Deltaproteobacteria bacterium]|nr:GIY-YIG nuclease family protein [Deltaproteobacteria bacterium]